MQFVSEAGNSKREPLAYLTNGGALVIKKSLASLSTGGAHSGDAVAVIGSSKEAINAYWKPDSPIVAQRFYPGDELTIKF